MTTMTMAAAMMVMTRAPRIGTTREAITGLFVITATVTVIRIRRVATITVGGRGGGGMC